MRIHHLNCGTLRPFGGRLVNGDRHPLLPARMVCHCLLVESDRGLVLVDSGFGLSDIDRLRRRSILPNRSRAGPGHRAPRQLTRRAYATFVTRPRLDHDETAVRQVARLGYSPDAVSDVVLTHLDLDHAGGLPDFPAARVHVHEAEHAAALSAARSSATSINRFRYWPYQWAHRPKWVTYGAGAGRDWFGFDGVWDLEGLSGIALVPLPGHTRGHCGVAVRLPGGGRERGAGRRWLLHAGDAYFDHRELDPLRPRSTRGLASFQRWFQDDSAARRASRALLRELAANHGDDVELICSHDPVDLERHRLGESSPSLPAPA